MVYAAIKIAGGFVPIPARTLACAWKSARAGDFRLYLAAREMAARRARGDDDRAPVYRIAELAGLAGVAERSARDAVRRLVALGLLEWSDSALGFPDPTDDDDAGEGLDDTIGRGKGVVAVPRRLLRFLAKGARPSLIATALGVLLRCLSRRKAGFDGRGRLKASWVARAFGVDERAVKAARQELIRLGWIEPGASPQWAMNRWGRAYRINLDWAVPRRESPPPRPPDGRGSPPPDLQTRTPSGGEKNQEPAVPAGPTGVRISEGGQGSPSSSGRDAAHSVEAPRADRPASGVPTPGAAAVSKPSRAPGVVPASGDPIPSPPPPPRLDDVRPEDLRDVGRALELHRQAVARRLIGPSEADRLKFLATVEHARAIGKANPCGLLARLVRRGWWHFATQGEEAAAHSKLKRHLWGDRSSGSGGLGGLFGPSSGVSSAVSIRPRGETGPPLSADARLVREVRSALSRANFRGDAFYALR